MTMRGIVQEGEKVTLLHRAIALMFIVLAVSISFSLIGILTLGVLPVLSLEVFKAAGLADVIDVGSALGDVPFNSLIVVTVMWFFPTAVFALLVFWFDLAVLRFAVARIRGWFLIVFYKNKDA